MSERLFNEDEDENSAEFMLATLKMDEAVTDMLRDEEARANVPVAEGGVTGDEVMVLINALQDKITTQRDEYFLRMTRQEIAMEGIPGAIADDVHVHNTLAYHEYAGALSTLRSLGRMIKRRNGDL